MPLYLYKNQKEKYLYLKSNHILNQIFPNHQNLLKNLKWGIENGLEETDIKLIDKKELTVIGKSSILGIRNS